MLSATKSMHMLQCIAARAVIRPAYANMFGLATGTAGSDGEMIHNTSKLKQHVDVLKALSLVITRQGGCMSGVMVNAAGM